MDGSAPGDEHGTGAKQAAEGGSDGAEVWCVVVAAGSGSRFGAPKQFAPLVGSTVLGVSVDAAAAACDGVVVVLAAGIIGTPQAEVPGADAVVPGGETRSASSAAGVGAVPASAGVILVHDAARPLASPALFAKVVDAVRSGAVGAIPVVPLVDTIRDRSGAVIDRDRLVATQTPQGFSADVLREAVARGGDATDDAALVEALGAEVVFVEGDPDNRKVTTPGDLAVAEAMVGARMSGEVGR